METIFEKIYFGNRVSDWLITAGILIATVVVVDVIGSLIIKKLKAIAERTTNRYDDMVVLAVQKFLFPIVYVSGFHAALSYLTLAPKADRIVHKLLILIYTYFVLRIITAILQNMVVSFLHRQEGGDVKQKQAKGFLVIMKAVIWAIGFVFALDNMGYEVSTILAGLGVGGIAIALAAQAVLADLFSYFIIFFDRPFEIGDFIVFETESGTVEYVGVKSTRIRTLNGQLLICSNKDLTNTRVNNYKNMSKRRILFKLGVAYNTSHENLEAIPGLIKEIIESSDKLQFDRGHFSGFGASSLDFEFVYYVLAADYAVYMDQQQAAYFKIIRAFEARGIEFAYPTQTLYVSGLKETGVAAAK